MDIGIGIPNTIPGTTGDQLLDWARRADQAGFSSLATIGALSYPGYEELTVFAAAGAVTEQIRFVSNVMIAPVRSTAELAKQAASVDQLTGGRLSLGLGVGWRDSDYALTEYDFESRGDRFDEMLGDLKQALAGEALEDGTRPVSPPTEQPHIPLLIGGTADATVRRVVEHGDGWTAGGMPPDAVAGMVEKVKSAWADGGRDGEPYILALAYFSLGDNEEESRQNLMHYYSPMGEETAAMIAGSAMRSPDAIQGALKAFEDVGVHEFILDPSINDPEQVDRLAEVVF